MRIRRAVSSACLLSLVCANVSQAQESKEEEAVIQIASFLEQVSEKLADQELTIVGAKYKIEEIVLHLRGILEGSVVFASGEGDAEMTIVIRRE